MDYSQTITALRQQKAALDETIAALERLTAAGHSATTEPKLERRGRKGMDPREREAVSIRMKKYWGERRTARANNAAAH